MHEVFQAYFRDHFAFCPDLPVQEFCSYLADDVTVCPTTWKTRLKVAVAKYKQIAGAKINFDKSKGLQLSAWRGGVPLLGPFCWTHLHPWYVVRASLQLE